MARRRRRKAHNQGCVYQRGPRNWWIKWRERGRIRYKGGLESSELADQIRAKIVADLQAGRAGLPAEPRDVPALGALADDWLKRREPTHRASRADRSRWKKHLRPFFGDARPGEVDHASIRRFIESKLAAGLNASTVGHCIRLLSSFFSDLAERGLVSDNPIRTLPRSTRRLYRATTDPRTTPFLESLHEVQQIFAALPEPVNVAFAIGALAGLRPGEILGLDWRDVDLSSRRMNVRLQVQGGRLVSLKDDESRVVPIQRALLPILSTWKLRSGGEGSLFKPTCSNRGGRPSRPPTFMRQHTLRRHLALALAGCQPSRPSTLTWYQATRHTFASHWVLSGGSLEKLAKVMGHSSIVVTERYAHLKPDLFREEDYGLLNIDLMKPPADVVPMGQPKTETGAVGYAVVTQAASGAADDAVKVEKGSLARLAQLDRALASGAKGHRFDSCIARFRNSLNLAGKFPGGCQPSRSM
jgi:integrase